MLFQKAGIYVHALHYALGNLTRDLKELEAAGLIAGNAELLAELGYWRCVNIGAGLHLAISILEEKGHFRSEVFP